MIAGNDEPVILKYTPYSIQRKASYHRASPYNTQPLHKLYYQTPPISRLMRRSRPEIYLDILSLCREERRISEIVYKCNLCHTTAKKYLAHLLRLGLIEADGEKWQDTKAGQDAIAKIGILKDVFDL